MEKSKHFTAGKWIRYGLSSVLSISLLSFAAAPALHAQGTEGKLYGESIRVYQTSKEGAQDIRLPDLHFQAEKEVRETQKNIRIYAGDKRQELLGIGGALTEASAYNLSLLSPEDREQVEKAYFSPDGAHYSLLRTTIGSADFSVKSYSYDDSTQADPELKHFNIDGDRDYLLPELKRVLALRPDAKIFAAPWAPPAWMKKSGVRRGQSGTAGLNIVDNSLDPRYYDSYAQYFVRYLQAYQKEGISIYSLSLQNEAQNNPKWEACTWGIPETARFIGKYLGPALRQSGFHPKLLIWDWDKGNDPMHHDGFVRYNLGVLADPEARQYIDGIAFHWYAGDLWHEIAGVPMWSEDFDSLDQVRAQHPEMKFYATEGCQEKGPWLHSFDPADRYIYDILNDFEHGTSSWIDWNLLLDEQGGPTQGVVNQCHAPIMMDSNHKLIWNPAYFVLKRLSHEIQPGSISLRSESNFSGVEKTAVQKANGETAVFLGNVKNYTQTVQVTDRGRSVRVQLPAHSLTTLVYRLQETESALKLMHPVHAQASSSEWNPFWSYGPEQTIDSSLNTRWASDWKDRESITFDLGKVYTTEGLQLTFECGQDAAYSIQVSTNGGEYFEVLHVDTNTYREQKKVTLTFAPAQARYVRFQGISRNNRFGYSIYDAQVLVR